MLADIAPAIASLITSVVQPVWLVSTSVATEGALGLAVLAGSSRRRSLMSSRPRFDLQLLIPDRSKSKRCGSPKTWTRSFPRGTSLCLPKKGNTSHMLVWQREPAISGLSSFEFPPEELAAHTHPKYPSTSPTFFIRSLNGDHMNAIRNGELLTPTSNRVRA